MWSRNQHQRLSKEYTSIFEKVVDSIYLQIIELIESNKPV